MSPQLLTPVDFPRPVNNMLLYWSYSQCDTSLNQLMIKKKKDVFTIDNYSAIVNESFSYAPSCRLEKCVVRVVSKFRVSKLKIMTALSNNNCENWPILKI